MQTTKFIWIMVSNTLKEDTQYHNIVTFGRQAELAAQYLRRGSSVMIEGRMQTRSWDGPDGVKKNRTEIVADSMQFGPRSGGGERGPSSASVASSVAKEETETIQYPEEDINPDDIPF